MRGGGLGGSRERRACKSFGSLLRERSGRTQALEGRGVGEVGVLIHGRWSVLAGLTGGDGAWFVQRAAPYSKGPRIDEFLDQDGGGGVGVENALSSTPEGLDIWLGTIPYI